ncbi:MAG: hypothetical protein PHV61_03845 [Limnochordia bacterium]|jgi:hypothetical protein|nr:hypothetical protein [Limnochordia bacterium]MDD2629285.1 hypothetical protein [Limnochordia bacterium]
MTQSEDSITETLVLAFIELIHERKIRGKQFLAATQQTIASLLSESTGLTLTPRHIQTLAKSMEQANLITIGGGGIGYPNTYDTREDEMGPQDFWNQVDAFLMVYAHPSRDSIKSQLELHREKALGGNNPQ